MNIMKRTLMLFAVMAIITTSFGQGRRSHGHPDMKTALSLDSVQYASIKGINKKYMEKMRSIRHDSSRTSEQKRDGWKELREERESEIEKVLTPEQKTKWSELKKQRVEDRKAARLEVKARRDNHLKSKLSLTDDQLAKMKSARKESFENARKDYDSKMKKILTTEQYNKWKEMNKERQDRRKK